MQASDSLFTTCTTWIFCSLAGLIDEGRPDAILQVAMMFLIKDKIYPEDIWRDWLLPTSLMVHPDIECDAPVKKCYTERVLMKPARSVYDEQGFFTFYVHSKPDAPAFKEGSIFYQREVKDRVQVRFIPAIIRL